jgi:acyl-CoA synthetase (AMP-forming)/AMP-acid ligase II
VAATFVDVLRSASEERPAAEAFTFLDHEENEAGRVSVGELDRRARAIAAAIAGLDLGGEPVLLVYPPGLDFVAALYGCMYAGAIAVPSPPPDFGPEHAAERIRIIVADAAPRAVMTTRALSEMMRPFVGGTETETIPIVPTDVADLPSESVWRDPGLRDTDLALLQYTSGSTGVPRGVMVTHRNLIENCAVVSPLADHPDARGVLWLPPYHDMGLIGGLLMPLYLRYPVTLMSPVTFLLRPLSWLRAIGKYRATMTGAPDFGYDLCVRRPPPENRLGLDLSTWRVAYNGAEVVRRETMDAFADAFEAHGFRRSAFYPCYGLAESTLIVTGGEPDAEPVFHEDQSGKTLVGCGGPDEGTRLEIVDPDTRELCGDDEVGEIWVRGPSVAAGYWRRDAETSASFGAELPGDDDGPYLRTGDLGFRVSGELFVTGRIKDLLVVGNRSFYPTDVERACQAAVPQLRRECGAAFVTGDDARAVLVQEVKPQQDGEYGEIVDAVRAAAQRSLELELDALALIAPRTIPRTTSGKIRRSRCRELFLDGELETIAEWSTRSADLTGGPTRG